MTCVVLQLTSVSGTQKLVTAEFLIFAVAQLFLFCWLSNDVKIKVRVYLHATLSIDAISTLICLSCCLVLLLC